MQFHPANIQDRDDAVGLLCLLHRKHGGFSLMWADGGYSGDKLRSGLEREGTPIEVELAERKSEGSEVLPRRWVVERTFARLGRCRRRIARRRLRVRWRGCRLRRSNFWFGGQRGKPPAIRRPHYVESYYKEPPVVQACSFQAVMVCASIPSLRILR